jgi:hypothetical protein
MTIAKTGTDVTRTAIGNRMLTIVTKTLFCLEALKVARISEDSAILKLAAPIKPTIRYKATHITIGNAIVL